MYLVDFIFDGIKLSDFGCMVGSAVTSNNESVEMGSIINLTTAINHGSYISEIVNADYPEVYTCEFDIFRKPCGTYPDNFTDSEVTWMMRWLNRKEYCKFQPLFDDEKSFSKLYMMGTFNHVRAIEIGGNVVGFALTFTTNSPFGYLDKTPIKFKTFSRADGLKYDLIKMLDESEENGAVYPKEFKITCGWCTYNSDGTINKNYPFSNGALIIINDRDNEDIDMSAMDITPSVLKNKGYRYTCVNNCVQGEVITFDCIHKIITSSLNYVDANGNEIIGHKNLYNDFNYVFPRLHNDMTSGLNTFAISLGCDISVSYNPIRKVGALV